jgi:hypothetical protein
MVAATVVELPSLLGREPAEGTEIIVRRSAVGFQRAESGGGSAGCGLGLDGSR